MKKLNINYRMKDVMKKLLIILLLISSVSIWAKEDEKDNPSRRFEEFAKEREYPKGYIPDNARVKAFQQMESIMPFGAAGSLLNPRYLIQTETPYTRHQR